MTGRRARHSLLDRLRLEPQRFSFDAAFTLLLRAAGRVPEPVRFHAPVGLAFVPADVTAVHQEGERYRMTTGLLGLTGPSGVMPRPYTELVNAEQRRRSPALAAMLDLLAQRSLAQLAAAGAKYRPHRAAELAAASVGTPGVAPPGNAGAVRGALLALGGYGMPGLSSRLLVGEDPLLFYAGSFASHPRSAERLSAILADWLGQPVTVEQFAGAWTRIDPGQMSCLPGAGRAGRFHQLGVDAAAGGQAWDIQSRITLRIGPLGLDAFRAMLPGEALLRRLCSLAAAYIDGAVTFAVNPVLAAAAVPPAQLGAAAPPRLGRDSWLPVARGRVRDADEAVFGPAALA